MTTNALLRRYVTDQSEPAFAELVRQHIDLVYSAALRQVNGDASAAQDVTQAVFTDLARQAPGLTRHPSLTGWLYTSTRYLAAKSRRAEQRRRAHEQEAHAMNQLLQSADPDPAWLELCPLLDDVMHELNATDREAVLMRYFERLPLAEVGARLHLTENAARMRVDRALDKLRVAFAKRGVTSTVVVLAGVLAERAVASAPAELATRVSQAAIATVAAGGGLGWCLLKLAGSIKGKLLVAAGATAVVASLLVIPQWLNRSHRTTTTASVRPAPEQANASVVPSATPPANAADPASVNSATTGNKLVLHIIAADTGEPIPMVTINSLLVEQGRKGTPMQLYSTSLGVCEVPVPRDTVLGLLVQSGIDGFADTSLEWNMNLGEMIPLKNSVAATRQSAANFPVSGKECGALPRRRYAGKVLKSSLGYRSEKKLGTNDLSLCVFSDQWEPKPFSDSTHPRGAWALPAESGRVFAPGRRCSRRSSESADSSNKARCAPG